MLTCNRLLVLLGVVFACSSCVSTFFLSWGATEPTLEKQPVQQWPVASFYQQRLMQSVQPGGNYDGQPQAVQIPAIPIQVPLQAQLSQAANVQNVQLVPCLCPVSPDSDYERGYDPNIFLNQVHKQSQ